MDKKEHAKIVTWVENNPLFLIPKGLNETQKKGDFSLRGSGISTFQVIRAIKTICETGNGYYCYTAYTRGLAQNLIELIAGEFEANKTLREKYHILEVQTHLDGMSHAQFDRKYYLKSGRYDHPYNKTFFDHYNGINRRRIKL